MDEYISRKVAIQAAEFVIGRDTSGENAVVNAMIAWNEYIKGLPSEDVQPVVRCKDCMNWIPGYITDTDEFIPPKCGKYQQMVGHSSDDFCSLGERKDGDTDG